MKDNSKSIHGTLMKRSTTKQRRVQTVAKKYRTGIQSCSIIHIVTQATDYNRPSDRKSSNNERNDTYNTRNDMSFDSTVRIA